MAQEVASLRGRLASHESARGGFATVLLVKADSNRANWQQQWVGSDGNSLTPFLGGMSNTAAYLDPVSASGGGTNVAALLQLRNGSNTAYVNLSTPPTVVKFGVLTSTWATGANQVTLTPCQGPTDGTPTGEPDVSPYIQFPANKPAPSFDGEAGDILAYMTAGGATFLVGAPVLPAGTQKFQVLVNTAGPGASNWRPDFVRARGA
jgi:hypothetical protein